MDAACHVHTSDTIYQCFICQHANVLSDSIVKSVSCLFGCYDVCHLCHIRSFKKHHIKTNRPVFSSKTSQYKYILYHRNRRKRPISVCVCVCVCVCVWRCALRSRKASPSNRQICTWHKTSLQSYKKNFTIQKFMQKKVRKFESFKV